MRTTMKPGEYRIYPSVKSEAQPTFDGVYVDLSNNAFIGKVVEVKVGEGDHINNTTGYGVRPFSDAEGDYLPLLISDEEFRSSINQVLVQYT